jgi:hypothetical protein
MFTKDKKMVLAVEQLDSESINTLQPLSQLFCPQCSSAMKEMDQLNENGAVYIWYKCGKSNCNGSWLKKLRKMNKCLDTLNKHVNFPNFYELKGVARSQKQIGGMFCDNRM